MRYRKLFVYFLCFIVLSSISCAQIPPQPEIPAPIPPTTPAPHVRRMETPPYGGGEAVIFVLDSVADASLTDTVDKVIRLFGENNVPLDIGLTPEVSVIKTYDPTGLIDYYDVGIIDISVDGYSLPWLSPQASSSSPEYIKLESILVKSREQFKFMFGQAPVSCVFPTAAFNETNYNLLIQSGFKVICAPNSASFFPSSQPTNWPGQVDPAGLYRLPIVGSVESGSDLLVLAGKSIDSMGVACIQIQPADLQGKDGKADPAKLSHLSMLIKSCQKLGQITTLESWYKYKSLASDSLGKERPLPPYPGGPVIIFRMDDVSKGYLEDVVQEIIKVFQSNGIPVDCGVVSNAGGVDTYKIPWLKQYFDQDAVGISVHGYDWTYYQMDTTRQLLSQKARQDDPCINWAAIQRDLLSENVTYMSIKNKLLLARAQYLAYYGANPIALTVPTDYFDEIGYKAIDDAGFKVFSTQISSEPHPSVEYTVDYFGKRDPNGMYRIPTAIDVCSWGDNCTWGDVIDLGKKATIKDYCQYHDVWQDVYGYNDYTWSICTTLEKLGVEAIGIHPSCFVGKDGKPDRAKLEKLDSLIKWFKSFSTIMTFDQWYRYKLLNKL